MGCGFIYVSTMLLSAVRPSWLPFIIVPRFRKVWRQVFSMYYIGAAERTMRYSILDSIRSCLSCFTTKAREFKKTNNRQAGRLRIVSGTQEHLFFFDFPQKPGNDSRAKIS